MAKFTNWFQRHNQLLEQALQKLFYSPNITFSFLVNEKEENIHPYLIPIETYGTAVCGLFPIDKELKEITIGFKHKPRSFITRHFDLSTDCCLREYETPKNETLYLPLQTTEMKIDLDSACPGKNLLHMYGIKGTEYDYPVCLVTDTDEGLMFRGLYRKPPDVIGMFYIRNNGYRKEFKEFMKSLTSKTDSIPSIKTQKSEGNKRTHTEAHINWHDPKSIVSYLDKVVIGQEQAKKAAAVVFSNYMIRKESGDESLPKEALILIGPTGSGKTMIFNKLAQKSGLPFAKASLTGKSSEGYVGHRLSETFKLIREKSDEEAPYGVVFLDEIDKIAIDNAFRSDFGPKLQQEIIGWIEGDKIQLKYDEGLTRKEEWMDTKNLLFIMAGAFYGDNNESALEKIINKRICGEKTIGFGTQKAQPDAQKILTQIKPEDLINYGLKPELVGRITGRATLEQLTTEDKARIIKESEDSILKRYANLIEARGYNLSIDEEVFMIIAEHSKKETGARDLNTICSKLFMEILYDPENYAKGNEIYITNKIANDILKGKDAKTFINSQESP